MNKKLIVVLFVLLFGMVGCAGSHFGVADKALIVPPDVAQTEEAIASAKQSAGAKYCPEKIAKAEALAKEAMDVYWACQNTKAMGMLADARNLADQAKGCQPPAPPAPAPVAPAPVPPPPVPAKTPVSFHSVYFDFDKSVLTPAAQAELDGAARIMMDNPDLVIELQGNTCNLGSAAYNKKLGDRRATAVYDYLVSKGIKAERLKTLSLGQDNPANPNDTKDNRSKNRRVELVVLQ